MKINKIYLQYYWIMEFVQQPIAQIHNPDKPQRILPYTSDF